MFSFSLAAAKQRSLFLIALMVLAGNEMFAQRGGLQDGRDALTDVGTDLNAYIEPITNICYIVAAIVGIIGGVQVYSKWASGDPMAGKSAAGWGAAAIFLILVPTIISALFGVTME